MRTRHNLLGDCIGSCGGYIQAIFTDSTEKAFRFTEIVPMIWRMNCETTCKITWKVRDVKGPFKDTTHIYIYIYWVVRGVLLAPAS